MCICGFFFFTWSRKYPFIYCLYLLMVLWMGWSHLQLTLGERQSTPWTSPSKDNIETHGTSNHVYAFKPKDNLERQNNLSVLFLDGKSKLKYLQRTYTCTGQNMQTPCEKILCQDFNPGPSFWKATVLPTVPQKTSWFLYYVYVYYSPTIQKK